MNFWVNICAFISYQMHYTSNFLKISTQRNIFFSKKYLWDLRDCTKSPTTHHFLVREGTTPLPTLFEKTRA